MKWDRKSSADVLKCLLSFHFLHKTLLLPSVSNLYCRCYHLHRSLFKISEIVLWKIAIIRYWIYKGKRALLAQLIACTFAQKSIIPELSKTYYHLVENILSPYITQLSSKLSGLIGLFDDIMKILPKTDNFASIIFVSNFDPQSAILVVMLWLCLKLGF